MHPECRQPVSPSVNTLLRLIQRSSACGVGLALTLASRARTIHEYDQTAVLTLFEIRGDRRDRPRLDARCRQRSGIAESCRAICCRSKRGGPRRARASSCAGRAWRSKRWRRGTASASRDGWATRRCCSRTARRFPRSPPSVMCCRATHRLRRSWMSPTSSTAADQVQRGSAGTSPRPRRDSGRHRRRRHRGRRRLGHLRASRADRKSDCQRQQGVGRSVDGRRARARHAHRRHHRRQQQRVPVRDVALPRRHRARRQAGQRARARRRRHRDGRATSSPASNGSSRTAPNTTFA